VSELFVLDSSVTLTWCFRSERTPLSEALLEDLLGGSVALVPSLWATEVANVLVRSVRWRVISPGQAEAFVGPLLSLPIEAEASPPEHALHEVRPLALRTHLNAYDATFLELAHRFELPLATLDDAMSKAARSGSSSPEVDSPESYDGSQSSTMRESTHVRAVAGAHP